MIGSHPSEYKLIAKKDSNWKDRLDGYKYLLRCHPEVPTPEGYTQILHLHGESVYTPDGRLKPKLWALERYR